MTSLNRCFSNVIKSVIKPGFPEAVLILYIDEVLSLKNTKFAEYLDFIYPRELEIKETTETAASSS